MYLSIITKEKELMRLSSFNRAKKLPYLCVRHACFSDLLMCPDPCNNLAMPPRGARAEVRDLSSTSSCYEIT